MVLTLNFVCMLLAFLMFCLAAAGVASRLNLMAVGLALMALSFMVRV